MLRLSHILTTAALVAVCAAPASAATFEQLQPADQTGDAPARPPTPGGAAATSPLRRPRPGLGPGLRSPDARRRRSTEGSADRDAYVLNRDYGSPDALDAAPQAGRPGA